MNRNACVLIRVDFALSCDGVLLAWHWFLGQYVAILENNCRVTEYEVYSAIDIAFSVELTIGVCVECVLVRVKFAAVKNREISS